MLLVRPGRFGINNLASAIAIVAAVITFAATGVIAPVSAHALAHVFARMSGHKSVIPARPKPNRDLASSGRPSLPEALSQGAHSPPNIG